MPDSTNSSTPSALDDLKNREARAEASRASSHMWYMIALALAATAAVGGLITSWVESDRSKSLSDIKDEVITEEARLAGIEIAKAQQGARVAEQKGDEAKRDAASADERAALAGQKAAEANERAAKLENDNLRLAKDIENLHADNLSVRRSIGDRMVHEVGDAIKALAPFANLGAAIGFFPGDKESETTARQIAYVLREAGWTFVGPAPATVVMPRGDVSVVVGGVSQFAYISDIPVEHRVVVEEASKARGILEALLNKSGMHANGEGWSPTSPVPIGTLVITVGRKADPAAEQELEEFLASKKPGIFLQGNEYVAPLTKEVRSTLSEDQRPSTRFFIHQEGTAKTLSVFAHMGVSIAHLPDPESEELAKQIALLLGRSGWKVLQNISSLPGTIATGVTVSVSAPAERSAQQAAANLLLCEFAKNYLPAKAGPVEGRVVEGGMILNTPYGVAPIPGIVIIQIGINPGFSVK